MFGRILAELTGEVEETTHPLSVDPERLRGLSSPPEEDGLQAEGLSSMWRAIPFLPGLVEAIVGTPYEDEEEDDNDDSEEGRYRRMVARARAAAGAAAPSSTAQGEASATRTSQGQEPIALHVSGQAWEPLSEPSSLLGPGEAAAIAALCPSRFRMASWRLAYSTLRDGISMLTMLRLSQGRAPTVLLVRDMDRREPFLGNVFGAFCSEAWKSSKRFYGTGETFVFRLGAKQLAWKWWVEQHAQAPNDYFMWGNSEGVAVGGAGGYALWLDNDFAKGLTRSCLTFGSPPLSDKEEFEVGAVELWWLK